MESKADTCCTERKTHNLGSVIPDNYPLWKLCLYERRGARGNTGLEVDIQESAICSTCRALQGRSRTRPNAEYVRFMDCDVQVDDCWLRRFNFLFPWYSDLEVEINKKNGYFVLFYCVLISLYFVLLYVIYVILFLFLFFYFVLRYFLWCLILCYFS